MRQLLDHARAEGIIIERIDAERVKLLGPKNEITDAIVKELRARKPEVILALTPCCGRRPVGVAGEPIVLSCQLCPNSPTYWRA